MPSSYTHLDVPQALSQIGDPGALREMLVMFQDMLHRDIPEISAAMERQDLATAKNLLHSIKGCMPIFCTPALCTELAAVEHLSKTEAVSVVAPAYSDLKPGLELLRAEVDAHLAASA